MLAFTDELIDQLRAGDPQAFESVLFAFEQPIYRYIYRMVSQREDAQDLTQDTFLKFYRYRHALRTDKNIKALLYTIATTIVYDWLRKQRRQPVKFVSLPDEDGNADDGTQDLIDHRSSARPAAIGRQLDLEQVLEKIKPEFKTVLLLYYQEGLSYEDISRSLSLPLNTVRTYLYRAKAAARKELLLDDGE